MEEYKAFYDRGTAVKCDLIDTSLPASEKDIMNIQSDNEENDKLLIMISICVITLFVGLIFLLDIDPFNEKIG